MKEMKPQKQLLQFVMLTLLSVFSVLVMANESFAALDCTACHGTSGVSLRPLDTPAGSPSSYRNITTGAFKGNHSTHLGATPAATNCAICHNNSGYTSSHRDGGINMAANINASPATATYGSKGVFFNQTSVPTLQTCSSVNCHFEKVTPAWGSDPAATDCDSCHSSAPVSASHAKHTAQYGDTASCIKCHAARTTFQHATSAGNAGRKIDLTGMTSGGPGTPVYSGSATNYLPSQTPVYGQCSTTYCHSTGQGFNATVATPTAYSTPIWGNTANCGSCHLSNLLSTGGHAKHIAKNGGNCGDCHTGATLATMTAATHVDGLIDVAAGVSYSQGSSSFRGNGYGTCSAASCHSPTTAAALVTPTWGQAATCASCHAVSPTTGSHTKHTAIVTVTCGDCHTGAIAGSNGGAGHFNNVIDVAQGYPAGVVKHAAGTYTGTCSTTCHSATTTAVATPIWGATATCTSCHVASPATGSHTKHVLHTNVTCGSCHTGAIAGVSGGAGHFDANIDVFVGGYPANKAKGSAFTSCSNISCHNGGNGVEAFVATAKTWGIPLDCAGCHGYPPVNGNHSGVVAGSCNGCHGNVNAGGNQASSSFVNVQLHLNGVVEGGKCDSCHGYPPVQSMAGLGINANYSSAKLQNYSGGGGVHSVAGHLPLTTKVSQGGSFTPCLTCHPQGVTHNQGSGSFLTANVQVVVDPQFKFDKNRPIVYNAKQAGTGKTSGTCANVACHFQKSPIWSSQPYTQGH